jgi:hypothetical protein
MVLDSSAIVAIQLKGSGHERVIEADGHCASLVQGTLRMTRRLIARPARMADVPSIRFVPCLEHGIHKSSSSTLK